MKSNEKFTCTFCEKQSGSVQFQGGEWHTHNGTIYCCHRCAITILPRLMADSIRLSGNGYVEGGKALKLAEGNFWKAMAARLSSRGGK